MTPIELSLFSSRIAAICEEMGAVLRRAAFSPNIKDRLDYSSAVFDVKGELCAQAAHIPVHLGSMAYAMGDLVRARNWVDGDMLVLNDPYLGGTHLPDVTLIAPVFLADKLAGFVANRAHHADIGCEDPGSMPIARDLADEGLVIAPSLMVSAGQPNQALLDEITAVTTNPAESLGDFSAQISANLTGVKRLGMLIAGLGEDAYEQGLDELNAYAERLARNAIEQIPDGRYTFADELDDDGFGHEHIPLHVAIDICGSDVHIDFTGSSPQVEGNLNCPLPVAAASVYYVFRCLMPEQMPACAGSMRSVSLHAPEGSILNARRPAAVAAGNVETSTRVVDLLLGALAQAIPEQIPAASHGSMNNLAMGSRSSEHPWAYYETIGGGMGASAAGAGISAVQTHMTNTLNTPIEALEMTYPLRIERYAVRHQSGGQGRYTGGNGIIRDYRFLEATQVTLLTERRASRPWGLGGGDAGLAGENRVDGMAIAAKVSLALQSGQVLSIATPGGGGWGRVDT